MKARHQFYSRYVDNKIRRNRIIQNVLILGMFGIVLHDSFVHGLPFHYVLYAIAGVFVGRIYRHTNKVRYSEEDETIREQGSVAGIVIAVIVLSTRFFAGAWVLEEFHVIYFSDALYLFFIGMHYSRVHSSARQIDEMVYQYVIKKRREP